MADEVRKVLFKVEIDTGATTASMQASTAATEKQTEAIKKQTEAIKAEEDSIAALRARNKELTAERNSTSTATEAGRIKIQKLNAELDNNNKVIKANVDAYTKQKIGIGDYSSAIDNLIPGLGGTINGIKGMTTAGLTFIATPIGLVIAAIGVALGSLMAYFKGSEEGQNRLNRIMLIGSTIMEKVMDVVEGLGEAIFDAFSNPKQALIDLVDFIKQNLINRFTALAVIVEGIADLDFKKVANGVIQLGTGVENAIDKVANLGQEIIKTADTAIKEGNRLADLAEKIDKDERKLVVERAKVSLQVSKLRSEATRQEGDAKIKTIKEAIALEEQLSSKEVALAKIRLENAEAQRDINGADKDALNEVAKATADVARAEENKFNQILKFEKELESLNEEKKRKREQEEEERKKKEEEEKERLRKEKEEQDKIDAEQAELKRKKEEEDAKKQADKEAEIESIKAGTISGLINKVTKSKIDGQKLYNTIFKKGAAAELLATTKLAAQAAFKSFAGIPVIGTVLGAAAYAAVYAKGLLDIAGINAIPFARGGRVLSGTRINSVHGIPINRANGDNLLATVRTGEVILNERQQRMLGGSRTFSRIGVPGFADGGVTGQETLIASNDFTSTQAILDLTKAIAQQSPKILVLEEFEAKQSSVNEIKNKAVII